MGFGRAGERREKVPRLPSAWRGRWRTMSRAASSIQ
jgi:hypothetical protein